MAEKIVFGIKDLHFAVQTLVGNVYSWGEPIPVPGAISLSLDPVGDTVSFKADNITFFGSTTNSGYSGSINIANLPEAILDAFLGVDVDANGVRIEALKNIIKPVAIGFRVGRDEGVIGKKVWIYNANVNRPASESTTLEESIEPDTFTLDYVSNPLVSNGDIKASIDEETPTPQAKYDTWFDAVYERDEAA